MISPFVQSSGKAFVAVWRRGGSVEQPIRVRALEGMANVRFNVVFPSSFESDVKWDAEKGCLQVVLPQTTCARLICLDW